MKNFSLPGAALFCSFTLVAASVVISSHSARAAEPSAGVAAVENDMHEFMEYVFEPAYHRLKETMAANPASTADWKKVKGDALTLAESANLLFGRGSDDDRAAWEKISTEVRTAGGQLYQAAKKKDLATARTHYQTMITKCNACHDKFAGGEHQLAP